MELGICILQTRFIILKHKNLSWNWKSILSGRNVSTINEIVKHKNLQWDWKKISYRSDLTWSIIKNNRDIPWYLPAITFHPNITWNIIKNNLDFPWVVEYVSLNININRDIIIKYKYNWCSFLVSLNPNISWEPFVYIMEPWSWKQIERNIHSSHPNIIHRDKMKKYKDNTKIILNDYIKAKDIINLIIDYSVTLPPIFRIFNIQQKITARNRYKSPQITYPNLYSNYDFLFSININ